MIANKALVSRRDSIARSMPARRTGELAISANDAEYRVIAEVHSEVIALARADGRVVCVNPACAGHFGRVPAQWADTHMFEFVPPRTMTRCRP